MSTYFQDLQEKCGYFLGVLASEHASSYRLGRALKLRAPPVFATDAVLKEWFKRYLDADPINSAGHLELKYGDRVREHVETRSMDAAGLRVWLRTHGVHARFTSDLSLGV